MHTASPSGTGSPAATTGAAATPPCEAEGGPSLVGEQLLWFLVSWFPGPLFWPLNLAAEIPVWLTIRRLSPRVARWNLFLSSSFVIPILSLLLTAAWYPSGRAKTLITGLTVGMPRHLDPYTRLYSVSQGCTGDPTNGLIQLPNWAAIYGLRRAFGPPLGAYRGPYPTEAEAGVTLSSGTPLTVDGYRSGHFMIGSQLVSMDSASIARIDRFIRFPLDRVEGLRAGIFKERCLILGLQLNDRLFGMVLIDLANGRPSVITTVMSLTKRCSPR